tara:strand:- start:278 stop:457 length:180 start_codon:yes stop_codon:yes gene_type:complete
MIEKAWKHFLDREKNSHTTFDPKAAEFDKSLKEKSDKITKRLKALKEEADKIEEERKKK